MKQVVLPTSCVATVHPEAASNDKFYGVQIWGSSLKERNCGRGFITREVYNGYLKLRSARKFTLGNGWIQPSIPVTSDLQLFISKLLKDGSYDVFEFSNIVELMEWVVKDDRPQRSSFETSD